MRYFYYVVCLIKRIDPTLDICFSTGDQILAYHYCMSMYIVVYCSGDVTFLSGYNGHIIFLISGNPYVSIGFVLYGPYILAPYSYSSRYETIWYYHGVCNNYISWGSSCRSDRVIVAFRNNLQGFLSGCDVHGWIYWHWW